LNRAKRSDTGDIVAKKASFYGGLGSSTAEFEFIPRCNITGTSYRYAAELVEII
jgi:hypothetical protein